MKTFALSASAFGLAVAGSLWLGAGPAKAGPFCLTDSDSPQTYRSCEYYSYAACRASSRGAGGSCVANPRGDDSYGYAVGPTVEFGNSYNRYDGPVYGGYVRTYRW